MSSLGNRVSSMFCVALFLSVPLLSQSTPAPDPAADGKVSELERSFFGLIRDADALKFLSYVPEDGVNLGRQAQHTTRAEVEQQLTTKSGLYCKLFDSACLQATNKAAASAQACSYRELLTQSEKVRLASTETTRNNVRQAILVAQVQNDKCGGAVLIDFIFNRHHDGWKLFSVP